MDLKLDYLSFPDKRGILSFVDSMKNIVFPNFFSIYEGDKEEYSKSMYLFKKYISDNDEHCNKFFQKVDKLRKKMMEDLESFYNSDPACDSYEEIISTYPGYTATFYYRIAHELYRLGLKVRARIISEEAHFLTGIDIHPGAKIGHHFFIDHGTGIVVGETTVIGDNCKLYQGVTLGALSLAKGQLMKGIKRHPTIGNRVTIYSGASILGGDVTIGDDVVIGSNVYICGESIPSNRKVIISKPKLIVIEKKHK